MLSIIIILYKHNIEHLYKTVTFLKMTTGENNYLKWPVLNSTVTLLLEHHKLVKQLTCFHDPGTSVYPPEKTLLLRVSLSRILA